MIRNTLIGEQFKLLSTSVFALYPLIFHLVFYNRKKKKTLLSTMIWNSVSSCNLDTNCSINQINSSILKAQIISLYQLILKSKIPISQGTNYYCPYMHFGNHIIYVYWPICILVHDRL